MDTSANLEARLGQSLDDLIKKQQTARKKDGERQGRTKVKKVKATKTVKVATKVLKATGGVSKAAKPRLGGRRGAPIQVAATTKAKITQARQAAPSTSASKPTALQNVQFRNANEARAAVEMMEPLLAKAQAMLTKKVTDDRKKNAGAKPKGRRVNTDVVMQGQGGGAKRRSRGGNRKK